MYNYLVYLKLYLGLIIVIANSCGGNYSLEQKPDFMIEDAHYITRIAGIKGGGSSIDVSITFSENQELNQTIFIKGLYFKDTYVLLDEKQALQYTAQIMNTLNIDNEERINKVNKKTLDKTNSSKESTFNLKPNEAVIYYTQRGKNKYYKTTLSEKRVTDMPM